MTHWLSPERPYSIAHRGASAYAPDCSVEAYEKAAALGADFWEVDIRLSADGVLITYHDAALPDGRALSALTAAEIAAAADALKIPAVAFAEIVALAAEHDAGIYADIKDTAAAVPVMQMLRDAGIERAILGAFDPLAAQDLKTAHSPYPRAVLVPLGADPFEYAQGADIVHLCWEAMERPQDMLDAAFFARAAEIGQQVVLWHEEDPDRMAALRELPVLGICSDRPELVHPFTPPTFWPVGIVCHRGACEFAPENTRAAAHCAFAAGFDFVELDVQQTADDGLVVFHDLVLNRTTPLRGVVNWQSLNHLCQTEAGSHMSPHFAAETIPTLEQILGIAQHYGGGLYVELKSADPERVLATVKAAEMLDRCFFWSFDLRQMQRLRQLAPTAQVMSRRQDFGSLEETLDLFDPDIVEFDMSDDLAEIETLRAHKARSMLAYMGREDAQFDRIVRARPDLVNLHYPFLFKRHLARVSAGS